MKCNWILFIFIFTLISSIIYGNRISSAIREEVDHFKSYIQRSSNPCNDIYSYSCGNYVRNVRETYDGYLKSVTDILSGKINSQIKELLTDYNNETNAFERRAILFYKSCRENIRNKTKIRQQLNEFIRSLSVNGAGWPVWKDTWNGELFDWFKVMARMKLYGFAPIIDGKIAPFPYNTTGRNFVISCNPKIGYTRNQDKQSLMQYGEDLRNIFLDYGARHSDARQYAQEVIEFEKGLHRIVGDTSHYENDNDGFQEYHYQRFKSEFWGVEWDHYFETVFGFHKLRGTYILIVEGGQYLRRVIEYISHTQPSVVANFLLASIASNTYELANPTDTPNFCSKIINDAMSPVISYMYLHKHFNEKIEIDVHDMMKTLITAHLIIWKYQPVNDDTILDIKNKLDNMRIVFFSDHIDIIESAANTYTTIDIDRWNFIKTYYKLIRHNHLLDMPKDYVRHMILISGNRKEPFYVKEKNAVVIPPTVLQPPYYHYFWPKLFKYSKLGFLLSRTIAQAFDSVGRTLDEYGNRRDWWMTRNDVSLQIEQKLITKYNEFRHNGQQIDGRLTLKENWADLFGIKGAYQGYTVKLLSRRNSDPIESMPRTGLSSNQTFFVSYAQIFCEEFPPYDNYDGTEVPPKLRVIGSLSLTEEFRYSFNCIV